MRHPNFRPSDTFVWGIVTPLLLLLPAVCSQLLGGEKATLQNRTANYRQNVCGRYHDFRDGRVSLRNGLSGLALATHLIVDGGYFAYHFEHGIVADYPGVEAEILDALAESANFTWRNSFGITLRQTGEDKTFTEILVDTTHRFDLSVHWWDKTLERMELGVSFLEPWFDGSIILIHQEDDEDEGSSISLLNFMKPFEPSVWLLTFVTVVVSSLVYQFIEYMLDEREERPFFQWLSDNLYLSSLSFTQNFEYAPSSAPGRIFGISLGVWALVMGATYTANLASLFVEQNRNALVIDSIEKATAEGIAVCTILNANIDFVVRDLYGEANILSQPGEKENYQALRTGKCGLLAAYKDNWFLYEGIEEYNPDCDLHWIGREVEIIKSGFAVKADAGKLCTGFIQDVLNVHMTELIESGFVKAAMDRHRLRLQDQNCATKAFTSGKRRRLEEDEDASAGTATSDEYMTRYSFSLTVQQMLGTFVLHWVLMAISILVSLGTLYHRRWLLKTKNLKVKLISHRMHGPIIGQAPRVNTFVLQEASGRVSNHGEDSESSSELPHEDSLTEAEKPESSRGAERAFLEPDWKQPIAELQQSQQELTELVMALAQEVRKGRLEKKQQ